MPSVIHIVHVRPQIRKAALNGIPRPTPNLRRVDMQQVVGVVLIAHHGEEETGVIDIALTHLSIPSRFERYTLQLP